MLSSFESVYTFYGSLVILSIGILWRLNRIGRRPKAYPPGPPTLPVIGNLHQIPRERRHLQFEEWAQKYGPIYSLMLGTKVMIVLNSDVAIKDLIDKRGAIYSSRPDGFIAQDILSGGLRVLFMACAPFSTSSKKKDTLSPFLIFTIGLTAREQPNNGAWNMARKLAQRILNVSAARTYVPYQDLENKAMLLGMLDTPHDFIDHLRRYTAALTTQMTFGFRTASIEDARFKEAFEVHRQRISYFGCRQSDECDRSSIAALR